MFRVVVFGAVCMLLLGAFALVLAVDTVMTAMGM